MKISDIIDAMQDEIVARNCFIVEINLSKDNDVELVIESENSDRGRQEKEGVRRACRAGADGRNHMGPPASGIRIEKQKNNKQKWKRQNLEMPLQNSRI